MDEFERRVAEELSELFADAQPPASLPERIMRGAALRRRRTAVVASAAAVLVAIALVAAPVAVARSRPTGPDPGPDPAVTTPAEIGDLDELVDLRAAVRIHRELPEQPLFHALALGPDGTVLGALRSGWPTEYGTGVWRAGPAGGVPELVTDTPPDTTYSLWAMAVGERGYLWPQGEELACLGPDGRGPVRTFTAGWGGRTQFLADGDAFVWSDNWRSIAVAERCGGPVHTFPVEGEIEAFAYPFAYVVSGTTMRRVDVRNGQVHELGRLQSENREVAATAEVLAWLVDDVLTIADPRTGTPVRAIEGPPYSLDPYYFQHLTAGEHVVVCSSEHQDTDDAAAIVYHLRSGKRFALPGTARAAGNWLLWRDGTDYLLAPVRP